MGSDSTFDSKFNLYRALKEKTIRLARQDSEIFSSYVFGYKNASFHREWHRFMDQHQYGQILAARDLGKCIRADRPCLVFRDGSFVYLPTKEISSGDKLWGWDTVNFKTVLTDVVGVFDNGIQPVFEIQTKSGRSEEVTAEHPFLCFGKWKTAENLRIGDYIGLASFYEPGTAVISREEARLLGYLTGAENTLCSTVFSLDESSLGHLLGSYFDCVGWVNEGGAWFSSASCVLLQQVQSLLLRLGIFSELRYEPGKYKGKIFAAWWLRVCHSHSLRKFAEKVFLVHRQKQDKLRDLLKRHKFDLNPRVPSDWLLLLKDVRVRLYYSTTYKEKAIRIAKQDQNDELLKWLQADLYWDKVVQIKEKMSVSTIGIQTKHSTILLSDLVTHNSEQATVARSCWEIGNDVNIRIKITSETDDLVGKFISRISATLLKNERYREVFPHVVPSNVGSWNKFSLTVERSEHHKDPTIEGGGVLTASTGGRWDLLFADDVVGMRNTLYYPRLREQVKEAFYSNWLNLADGPKARWYLIGTPWHINDLVTEIRNNKNVPHCHEIWVGDNFKSPWPERFPDEYFKSRLGVLKQRHYNRAYRGIALTDEESWINPMSTKSCRDLTLKAYDVISNPAIVKFTGIDLGHREGPEACPSVIFTIGRTPTGKRIPCDIKIIRETASPLDLGRAIIRTWEDLHPSLIFCENNGAQKYLVDLLQTMGPKGIPIEGYTTGAQKVNPDTGVPSLLSEIETGQWVVPLGAGGDHEDDCACVFCFWLNEVKNYPLGTKDVLMASWFALEALRKLLERGNSQGNFSIWEWR